MSLFQHQYALIEEVWNQPMFAPSIVNRYKTMSPPEKSPEPEEVGVTRFLNETYKTSGIAGVKKLLDPAIIRDIQAEVVVKQAKQTNRFTSFELEKEDWMYVLLGLFAIMLALDSSASS